MQSAVKPQPSQWGPAAPPTAAMPGPPPGQAALPPAPGQNLGPNSPFNAVPATQGPPGTNMAGGGSFAGQSTVNPQAGPADYAGVQGFADQAYEQARRNIDPMQDQARRRMEQDLINKGIDPTSAQGMGMLDQQNRNFTDQNNAANFGALQFGQGIQQQMFGQDLSRSQLAGQMQQSQWQNQTAQRGQDVQKYGMNLQNRLGMGQLDMARQGQDFNQMMGLEGTQFRNRAYNDSRSDYQDALTMSLMGITPVPGVVGWDPAGLAGQQLGQGGGGIIGALF